MMWALLFLLFPVAEIYVLIQVGSRIGVVNTLFTLLLSAVFGVGLAKTQGRYILEKLKYSVARGAMPENQVLHGLLVFLGGVLFVVPGFLSDVIGLIFVLPGTRHLVIALLRKRFERKIMNGEFRVFTDFTGAGVRTDSGNDAVQNHGQDQWMRDASPKIIDVRPVSSSTIEKDESEN